MATFVAIEARLAHPLLPLRVVVDRNRGASYLAIFVVTASLFGVFLFLTFYLQNMLGYSAIRTGFAFLPLVVALSLTSVLVSAKLLPRLGPRPLVPPGLVVAAVGMSLFTRLGAHADYVRGILPGLLVLGVGLGFAVASSANTAPANVGPDDAGVASAMVNTSQQIGGSIGTSLLNTIAASSGRQLRGEPPAEPDARGTSCAAQLRRRLLVCSRHPRRRRGRDAPALPLARRCDGTRCICPRPCHIGSFDVATPDHHHHGQLARARVG